MEEEMKALSLSEHTKVMNDLLNMGRGTGLKLIQRVMLQWYEPFVQEIKEEIRLIREQSSDEGRRSYGPYIMLLPPDKLALLTIHTTFNSLLRSHNNGALVLRLSLDIADVIQTEFLTLMHRSSSSSASSPPLVEPIIVSDWRTELVKQLLDGGNLNRSALSKIKRLMDCEEWPQDVKVKLGSALLALLLQTAKYMPSEHGGLLSSAHQHVVQDVGVPAMLHSTAYIPSLKKRVGMVKLEPALYEALLNTSTASTDLSPLMIQYMPMLVPPLPWNNGDHNSSPYLKLKTTFIRTFFRHHLKAVQRSNISPVLESINYISSIPWKINRPIYQTVTRLWEEGIVIGIVPDVAQ